MLDRVVAHGAPGVARWLRLAPAMLFLAIGLILFPSAGPDDKYISYWPAHTLASDGEILNYNGERVEQSSSLLLVLLVATVVKITPLDPPMAAWLLGVFGGLAALVVGGRLAARCGAGGAYPAMLLSSASGCFVYWSFSGTEAPLVALSAGLVVLASRPLLEGRSSSLALARSAAALSLFLTVRPESPHVALCTSVGVLVLVALGRTGVEQKRRSLRGAALLLGEVVVLSTCLVLFRLWYFDSFVPQPALVKHRELDWILVREGLHYLGEPSWRTPLYLGAAAGLLAAVWEALRSRTPHLTRIHLALFCFAYTGFVVCVGGDWMEGARFVAHVLPLLVALALSAVYRIETAGWARGVTAVLVLAALISTVRLGQTGSLAIPFWAPPADVPKAESGYTWLQTQNREHRQDILLAEALKSLVGAVLQETPGRVTIASERIGLAIYFTAKRYPGRIGTVDLHGLSDRYLADLAHPHSRAGTFGLTWEPDNFYARFYNLLGPAGVPFPEIAMFQEGSLDARRRMAAENGIEIVYWTHRAHETGPSWMRGGGPRNVHYITIDEKFSRAVGDLELEGNALDRSVTPSKPAITTTLGSS